MLVEFSFSFFPLQQLYGIFCVLVLFSCFTTHYYTAFHAYIFFWNFLWANSYFLVRRCCIENFFFIKNTFQCIWKFCSQYALVCVIVFVFFFICILLFDLFFFIYFVLFLIWCRWRCSRRRSVLKHCICCCVWTYTCFQTPVS